MTTTTATDLRRRVLAALDRNPAAWERCWPYTDAYGEPGYLPPQGYDWSGFRDSSDDAIRAMAEELGVAAKAHTAPVAMADAVADATADAFSWDTYGEQAWRACCRMLARRGYNAREIEAIMRSKWTRWAGDHANKSARVNSADLARFMDECYADPTRRAAEVRELVLGTFGYDEAQS